MPASYYTQQANLSLLLRGVAWAPADYYLAISTTPWAQDGTGGTEPATASGYARVHIAAWDTVATGIVHTNRYGAWSKNTNDLTFPVQTANWNMIGTRYWGVFDAAARATGNLLYSGGMGDVSGGYGIGKQVRIPAGAIYLQFTDFHSLAGLGRLGKFWLEPLAQNFFGQAILVPPVPWAGMADDNAGFPDTVANTWTEASGGGYARVDCTGKFAAPASSGGVTKCPTNAALTFTFTAAGGSRNYSPVVFDASTAGAGHILFSYDLGHVVNPGDSVQLDAGGIALGLI